MDLEIQPLRGDAAELDLMARWLGDPRVCEWLEGPSSTLKRAEVESTYSAEAIRRQGLYGALIVTGGFPIGFIQWYPVAKAEDYELDTADGTWGIDLFIGEPSLWGKGIGTRAVRETMDRIFREAGVRRIVIDPHLRNGRAVRCYEKAGFRRIKVLKGHERYEGAPDDCWLMIAERPPTTPGPQPPPRP